MVTVTYMDLGPLVSAGYIAGATTSIARSRLMMDGKVLTAAAGPESRFNISREPW